MPEFCLSSLLSAVLLFAITLPGLAQTKPRAVSAEAVWVEKTLKSLTLRQKLGQMIIVAVNSDYANFESGKFKEATRQLVEYQLGGFIVNCSSPNTASCGGPNEVAALTNELQRRANVPLFFAADYERGLRMRSRNGTAFTTAMGVAAAGDSNAAYTQGKITAQEMRATGVNWLYGPVADINNNPDNPVINIRSYGANPQRVAEFVAAATRGVRDGGALATLKHFPGHGDTATDSHIGLPVLTFDRKRLDTVELVPFRAGLAAGVDSVMTAHIALPNVTGDNLPATLNPKLSNDLLRRELGFDGIIVTDSLEMGAVNKLFPNGGVAVQAVKAGADLALMPPDPKAALDALEKAVNAGEITEERINQSVRRLLRAKYRLGLARNRLVDLAAVNRLVEKPENVRTGQETATRAITLLRNGNDVLPLDAARASRATHIIIAADDDQEEGHTLAHEIQRRTPNAKIIKADPRTTAAGYEKMLNDAAQAETLIVSVFVKRAALKGTVALPETQAEFVRKLLALGKPCAVIAFGSPYLIRQFSDAPAYAVTYAIEDIAQTAAARVLFGETYFTGKLPVNIPGFFEARAGIATDKGTGHLQPWPCSAGIELLRKPDGSRKFLSAAELRSRIISLAEPKDKLAHAVGTLLIMFQMGTDGRVQCVNSEAISPIFRRGVLAAAQSWQFTPVTVGGKPVAALGILRVDWRYGPSEFVWPPDTTKDIYALTVRLPDIDQVELLKLEKKGDLPTGEIEASKVITGPAAGKIARLWRQQIYLPVSAICHFPAYAMKFYRNGALLVHATLCWDCDNIAFLTPELEQTQGFAGTAKPGKQLLRLLKRELGK